MCDELGLVVWSELPINNRFSINGTEIDSRFEECSKEQIKEMIRQNYNSPSVILWGMSNELNQMDETVMGIYENLNSLAKEEEIRFLNIDSENGWELLEGAENPVPDATETDVTEPDVTETDVPEPADKNNIVIFENEAGFSINDWGNDTSKCIYKSAEDIAAFGISLDEYDLKVSFEIRSESDSYQQYQFGIYGQNNGKKIKIDTNNGSNYGGYYNSSAKGIKTITIDFAKEASGGEYTGTIASAVQKYGLCIGGTCPNVIKVWIEKKAVIEDKSNITLFENAAGLSLNDWGNDTSKCIYKSAEEIAAFGISLEEYDLKVSFEIKSFDNYDQYHFGIYGQNNGKRIKIDTNNNSNYGGYYNSSSNGIKTITVDLAKQASGGEYTGTIASAVEKYGLCIGGTCPNVIKVWLERKEAVISKNIDEAALYSCAESAGENKPQNDTITEPIPYVGGTITNRFTSFADNQFWGNFLKLPGEIVGYNQYYGWYKGEAEDLGPWLDSKIKGTDNRPLALSEYGAGGSIYQHSPNPNVDEIDPNGMWQPENYQSMAHEKLWWVLSQRPQIWGKFIWCMFDFASDSRQEGTEADYGLKTKGLGTRDRQLKDAYYLYKSVWNNEPMVHLNEQRYIEERPMKISEIKAYSNAYSCELFVNGESMGTIYRSELEKGLDTVFVWKNVTIKENEQSEIKVIAKDQNENEIASDDNTAKWTGYYVAPEKDENVAFNKKIISQSGSEITSEINDNDTETEVKVKTDPTIFVIDLETKHAVSETNIIASAGSFDYKIEISGKPDSDYIEIAAGSSFDGYKSFIDDNEKPTGQFVKVTLKNISKDAALAEVQIFAARTYPAPVILFDGNENAGAWKYIASIAGVDFSDLLTDRCQVVVEYKADSAPQLTLHSWSGGKAYSSLNASAKPESGIAVFNLSDIISAYESENFSTLDKIEIFTTYDPTYVYRVYITYSGKLLDKKVVEDEPEPEKPVVEYPYSLFSNENGKTVTGSGKSEIFQMKRGSKTSVDGIFAEHTAIIVKYTSKDAPLLNIRSKTSPFNENDNIWLFMEPSYIKDGAVYFTYEDVKQFYLEGFCEHSKKAIKDLEPDFEKFLGKICDWIGIYTNGNTVTVTNISIDKTAYAVRAENAENGTIKPSGVTMVKKGENQKYVITADEGYIIKDVKVNGESVGTVSEYIFENVNSDQTIAASFEKNTENTEPDDTKPDDTKPDDTEPDDTKPDDTKPDDTKPHETDDTVSEIPAPITVPSGSFTVPTIPSETTAITDTTTPPAADNFVTPNTTQLTNDDGTVKVEFAARSIKTGALLDVKKGAETSNSATFDITLKLANAAIQPYGTLTITITVPANLLGAANYYVYRLEPDGTYTDMLAAFSNGKVTFKTGHLSQYVITTIKLSDMGVSESYSSSVIVQNPDNGSGNLYIESGIIVDENNSNTGRTGNGKSDDKNEATGVALAFVPAATVIISKKRK